MDARDRAVLMNYKRYLKQRVGRTSRNLPDLRHEQPEEARRLPGQCFGLLSGILSAGGVHQDIDPRMPNPGIKELTGRAHDL